MTNVRPFHRISEAFGFTIALSATVALGLAPALGRADDITTIGSNQTCYDTCDTVLALLDTSQAQAQKDMKVCKGGGLSTDDMAALQAEYADPSSGVVSDAASWCARHGHSSYASVPYDTSNSNYAEASESGSSCPAKVLKEDVPDGTSYTTACDNVTRKLKGCDYLQNSELTYQCMAYMLTAPDPGKGKSKCQYGEAHEWQWAFVAVDTAVAGVCFAACGLPSAVTACTVASIGAGAAEMVGGLTFKANNDASQWIAGIGGAAGGLMGAAGASSAFAVGAVAGKGTTWADASFLRSLDASQSAREAARSAGGDVVRSADAGPAEIVDTSESFADATEAGEQAGSQAEKSTKTAKAMACATGALYSALALSRALAIHDLDNASTKVCESIRGLASQTTGGSWGTSSGSSSGTSYGTVSAAGAGSSSSGSGTSGLASSAANYLSCVENGGSTTECAEQTGTGAQVSAATAGMKDGMGQKGGLRLPAGTGLGSLATLMKNQGFMAGYDKVASSLPAEGRDLMNSFRGPLQKDGVDFVRSLGLVGPGVSGTLASLTGGRGSGGASGAQGFPFKFGAGGTLSAPGSAMSFSPEKKSDPGMESTDIWHEADPRSLFQIVSKRIDRTRDRVDSFEWDSPLNRALHGLSRKPAGSDMLTPSPGVRF